MLKAIQDKLALMYSHERIGVRSIGPWFAKNWLHCLRIPLGVLAIYVAYLYALSNAKLGKISPDFVSMAWFGLGVALLIFTELESLPTPWGVVKLKQTANQVADTAVKFESLLKDLSDLSQNWISAIHGFLEQVEAGEIAADEQHEALRRFGEDRMSEAQEFFGQGAETIRLSLWAYSPEDQGLIMMLSIGVFSEAAITKVFKPGEGLLGQAFRERRVWNLDNAQGEPGYLSLAGDTPVSGLLMMPLPIHDKPQYVLVVDRQARLMFDAVQLNVAECLGHILIIADNAID